MPACAQAQGIPEKCWGQERVRLESLGPALFKADSYGDLFLASTPTF